MFYLKQMHLAEWPEFQNHFETAFIALGGPESMALFHKNDPGYQVSTIAAMGAPEDMLENLSPGGWSAATDLEGDRWSVLVANGDAATRFGVQTGRD